MAEAVIATVEFFTALDGLTITLTTAEAFAAAAALELVAVTPVTGQPVRRSVRKSLQAAASSPGANACRC